MEANIYPVPQRILPEGSVRLAVLAGLEKLATEGKSVIVLKHGVSEEIPAQEVVT